MKSAKSAEMVQVTRQQMICVRIIPPDVLKQYPEKFQEQYLSDCHEMTQADVDLKKANASNLEKQYGLIREKQEQDRLVLAEQVKSSQNMRYLFSALLLAGFGFMIYFFATGNTAGGYALAGLFGAGLLSKVLEPLLEFMRHRR